MHSTTIMITSAGMGTGDPQLQITLLDKYLQLLVENNTLPDVICFYTEGVRLAVEGSPVIERLKDIEARGVRLVLCSTCLNFYGLADQVKVGIVGGMGDIIEAQLRADKIINL